MLAGLLGTVVAAGLLLRGAWDLWAQTIVLLVFLAGGSAWLCLRLASGWIPRPERGLPAWVLSLAVLSAAAAWLSPARAYALPGWAAAAAGLALIPFVAVLDAEGRERFERLLRAASWALVLLAFYQRLHGDLRPAAALVNPSVFGGAILLLLPLAVRGGDWALTAGLMVGLWWTRSVGAWVGLSIALIVHRRAVGTAAFWLGCAAGFVGLVAAYAKLQSPEILHRVEWWRAAWRMAAAEPWLGLGPGAFARLSTSYAHQHLLETAAERGVPYLLVWLAGLAAILRPAPAGKRFGPFAALVQGFVDYPLSIPGVFWLFCACAALATPESGESVNIPLRWRPVLIAAVLGAAVFCGTGLLKPIGGVQ